MTDFDYENRQKKEIARSASKRKCGSKSKKCTLPSDRLTNAQRNKLNGPVTTANMNAPMTKSAFLELPNDLKREYLTNLTDRYNVNQSRLGEMFGVSQRTVCNWMHDLGVASSKCWMTKENINQWNLFIGGHFAHGSEDAPSVNLAADRSIVRGSQGAIDDDRGWQESCEPDKEPADWDEATEGRWEGPTTMNAKTDNGDKHAYGATSICVTWSNFPSLAQIEDLYRALGNRKAYRVRNEIEAD